MSETLPDIPTSYVRMAVLVVFSALTLYMAVKGNTEATIGFASTITMYFLSRQGA